MAVCEAWFVSPTSAQQKVADARQPVTWTVFQTSAQQKLLIHGSLWRLACFLNICPRKSWWCRQLVMPGLFPKHLPSAQQKVADARQPVMPVLFPKHLPNKKLKSCWCMTTCDTWASFPKHLPNKKLLMHYNLGRLVCFQTSAQQKVADARQPVMPGLYLPNEKLTMQGNLWHSARFPNICPAKLLMHGNLWRPVCFPNICPVKLLMHGNLWHPAHFPNICPAKLLMHCNLWHPARFPNICPAKLLMHGNLWLPALFPNNLLREVADAL
jgi:hypothetical protein